MTGDPYDPYEYNRRKDKAMVRELRARAKANGRTPDWRGAFEPLLWGILGLVTFFGLIALAAWVAL